MNKSLPSLLTDIARRSSDFGGPLPDEAKCQQCDQLFADHPAVIGKLAAMNLPGLMVSCQCAGKVERMLKAARLPNNDAPKTFANFNAVDGTVPALRECREYAAFRAPFHVLTLIGRTGSGKSHLAEAVGRVSVDAGRSVLFQPTTALLQDLRTAQRDESGDTVQEILWRLQSVETLILDDLGAERPTEYAVEQLTWLIEERYRRKLRLLVTTNLLDTDAKDERGRDIPNSGMESRLGGRITSRLYDKHSGHTKFVVMTADDYRRNGR